MKREYKMHCKKCGEKLVKAGKNSMGKQMYKCNFCGTRTIHKKEKTTMKNVLKMFVKWITDSTKVVDKIDMNRRKFDRKISWCWDIIPSIIPPEFSSKFVFIDATYLSKNCCLLIVRDGEKILNFRWAETENFYEYYELLKFIPAPQFVICDGHTGMIKACLALWKNVIIQRCLVHISRDAERKLGKKSPCEINHIFRKHIAKLPVIDTEKKSKNWLKKFNFLYEKHKDFIEELSYSINEETGEVIRSFRTHKNLFSVCNGIKKIHKKGRLFAYIGNGVPNNSNAIEGGINSPLKYLLRCHRGLSLERQKRMLEWYLLKRSGTSILDFINSLNLDELYHKNVY
jgi:DNA-directed RNA polymerase subunit RPC12/RpoP